MDARLLVFDLDGTLVDSKEDLADAVNHALAAHGRPTLAPAEIFTYIGDGTTMLVRRALGPRGESLLPAVLSAFLDRYREHLLDRTVPYPGVPGALAEWSGRYRMAVLTNKPRDMALPILEGLGLSRFFSDVRGGDSFPSKKPDPEGLLAIIREAGVQPRETLMVGDSANDIRAGKAAGTGTCGVLYGLGTGGFLSCPPDFTVERFPDLSGRIRPALADRREGTGSRR